MNPCVLQSLMVSNTCMSFLHIFVLFFIVINFVYVNCYVNFESNIINRRGYIAIAFLWLHR